MHKKDNFIIFSKQEKSFAIGILKEYMYDNFGLDIGDLQSEIMLEHISKKFGHYFYNKGIEDSIKFMTEKTEDLYVLMKEN